MGVCMEGCKTYSRAWKKEKEQILRLKQSGSNLAVSERKFPQLRAYANLDLRELQSVSNELNEQREI
jgi:hypothetical protein